MAPTKGSDASIDSVWTLLINFQQPKESLVTEIKMYETGIWEVSLNKCGSKLNLGQLLVRQYGQNKVKEKREEVFRKEASLGSHGHCYIHHSCFPASTLQSPTGVKSQVPMEGCNSKEQRGKCGIKEDAGRKTNTI